MEPVNILLVEDDPSIQNVFKTVAQAEDKLEIIGSAESYAACRDWLQRIVAKEVRVDFIILDNMMPESDDPSNHSKKAFGDIILNDIAEAGITAEVIWFSGTHEMPARHNQQIAFNAYEKDIVGAIRYIVARGSVDDF